MAINEQWNIKARAHQCALSQRPFTDGEPFHTAIFRDPESGDFIREDYSVEGWNSRPDDAPAVFSHWRSIYCAPPPKEEAPQVVKKEGAEDLLRRLIEEDAPDTENVRFIIAVMLERQKTLKQVDRQKIGSTNLLIYEHRKSGDVLMVADPGIPLDQVDQIQQQVFDLLEKNAAAEENKEEHTPPENN